MQGRVARVAFQPLQRAGVLLADPGQRPRAVDVLQPEEWIVATRGGGLGGGGAHEGGHDQCREQQGEEERTHGLPRRRARTIGGAASACKPGPAPAAASAVRPGKISARGSSYIARLMSRPVRQDERARQRLRRGRGPLRSVCARRRRGAGHRRAATAGSACDQLVAIEPSADGDAFMRIWNADGGEVAACGNAARCVAWLLMQASGRQPRHLGHRRPACCAPGTRDRRRSPSTWARRGSTGATSRWPRRWIRAGSSCRSGPSTRRTCTRRAASPWAIRHVVFFVKDAGLAPVREVGSMIENHMLFPQGVNVGFAEVQAPRPHPPAGMGARRGRDPGLRHRGLRGPGGGAQAGPGGAQGGGLPAGRGVAHRLARGTTATC